MKKSHIVALLTSSVYLTRKAVGQRSIDMDENVIYLSIVNLENKKKYVILKKNNKGLYHRDLLIKRKKALKVGDNIFLKFKKINYDEHPFIIVELNKDSKDAKSYRNSEGVISSSAWTEFKENNKYITYTNSTVTMDIKNMEAGKYEYFCKFHANMGGTITII